MPVSKVDAAVGLLPSSSGTQAGRGEELPPAEPPLHPLTWRWESYLDFQRDGLS